MNGSTPDFGKWSGVNAFVRAYANLAKEYVSITNDTSVNVYDTDKLKSSSNTGWLIQKANFDTVYADVLMLHNLLAETESLPKLPIYNLFISGSADDWAGAPFLIEESRCIREYTSKHISERYGDLDAGSIAELMRAPSLFAYERGVDGAPKFGYIRDVSKRQEAVRIEYQLHHIDPFLTADQLGDMKFELDIGKLELYRTHWAVKEINLAKELHLRGITIPASMNDITNAVDISTHTFDVALSFPGEARPLVEKIALQLERVIGPNTYFYDNNYVSQLAQPSLDILLQNVYRRAILDVAFLSADYQRKEWCGVEFRAIREIIQARENSRVMFVRTADGSVDGVFNTDGYIDAQKFAPAEIAEFIHQRLNILKKNNN